MLRGRYLRSVSIILALAPGLPGAYASKHCDFFHCFCWLQHPSSLAKSRARGFVSIFTENRGSVYANASVGMSNIAIAYLGRAEHMAKSVPVITDALQATMASNISNSVPEYLTNMDTLHSFPMPKLLVCLITNCNLPFF